MMPSSVVSTVQLIWSMIMLRKIKSEKPPISRSRAKSKRPNVRRMRSFLAQYQMLNASVTTLSTSVTTTSATDPSPISSSGSITMGFSTVRIILMTRWKKNRSFAVM